MYIYLITHPKFEGWVKLGRAKNLSQRLRSYQTHCPDRAFEFVFSVETKFCTAIENYFYKNIAGNEYEWFKCDIETAINSITNQLKVLNNKAEVKKSAKVKYQYNYLTDGKKFNTIDELATYIKTRRYKIEKVIGKIKCKIGLSFTIDGYEIIRVENEKTRNPV